MRLPLLRNVATGVLLLDALAIGAAALHVEDVVTRTTTALPVVVSAPATPGSAVDLRAGTPGAPLPVTSLSVASPDATGALFADVLAQLSAAAGTDEPPSHSRGPTVAPTPATGEVPGGEQPTRCPLPLSDLDVQAALSPVLALLTDDLGTVLAPGLDVGTQLAAALAPYTQTVTGDELGGCIVELRALLTASASEAPSAPGAPALNLSTLGLGGLR